MRRLTCAVMAAVVFSVGCGKSEEEKAAEKAAEDVKKAAESIAQAAEKVGTAAAVKGTTEAAKAMEAVAAALGGTVDGKPVEPVAFQKLQETLPEVSGWKRGEPEGQRMTSPFPFSESEAKYEKGDANIEVKIVDTGFAQMLIAPWSMMMAAGYSREGTNGYEKATTVGGNPGFEKWNKRSKNGELNVLVGKRFMVTIEGRDLDDTAVLQEFASKIDFGKIAALK